MNYIILILDELLFLNIMLFEKKNVFISILLALLTVGRFLLINVIKYVSKIVNILHSTIEVNK